MQGPSMLSAAILIAATSALVSAQGCVVGGPSGLTFDGMGSFVGVSAPGLDVTGTSLTIEAWIHPAGPGNGPAIGANPPCGGIIVNKEGEYEIARFADGLIWYAIATGASAVWSWEPTTLYAPIGEWSHVALTYAGGAPTIHVANPTHGDSTFVAGNPPIGGGGSIGDASSAFDEFRIGGRQQGPQTFHGVIRDVRIWNIVRGKSDIDAAAYAGLVGNESGLLGWWPLNDGSGSIAANAAAGGPVLNGVLAHDSAYGSADPAWIGVVPACGQRNSPCARLEINGVGAGAAPGPFAVHVSTGSILTFDFQGPPGTPFDLFVSPVLNVGQSLIAPAFVIDLGTPPYFNVALAFGWDSPHIGSLFTIGQGGSWSLSLTVPVVAAGVLVYAQGLMIDASANPCAGFPYATTASFAILSP
jgi:hypothetical protein